MPQSTSELFLLAKRRFAPLFVTNLLGVFNDNLFKTGLLVMGSYVIYRADPAKSALLGTLATGVFILPFFLFSAMAGQLADVWERARMVRLVKLAEVAIMALGLAGFCTQSIGLLLTALFLMGVHSSVYGPLKYAILPQQLHEGEILGGTGLMEAGGFVAILAGQLAAGLVAPWQAGALACALAAVGLAASLAIPSAPPAEVGGRIELNVPRLSWRLVRMAMAIPRVRRSILGIAWFYAVGAVLLGELIPLVKGMLHARQEVAVLFLAVFSVGVAVGSLLVNRLLKGAVSARYTPAAALLLGGFLLDLSLAIGGFHARGEDLGMAAFIGEPGAWRIVFDLAVISICGGVFVIPLLAVLQTASPPEERSRILAANNIVNAGITVAAIAVAAVLLKLGASISGLIALMGLATLALALVAALMTGQAIIKPLSRWVLKRLFQVEIAGVENMPPEGSGAVVVVNHVSYLDGPLMGAFLPGRPTFAIHTAIYNAWWMKPVLPMFDSFPVDVTKPLSAKAMIKTVREGRTLVMFPEGRITVTGALMKVFSGPAMVADKANALIVPVRVDGPQYSFFSHMKGKQRLRLFPKVRITVLPPVRFDLSAAPTPRKRRALATERLYTVMSDMMFATADLDRTLYQALRDARAVHGAKALAIEDVKRKPLSYDKLLIGARVLGDALAPGTEVGEAVGVMLPNVNPAIATFFALQRTGRVCAMLNYTAGAANLQSACETAKIRTIVTSRAFVEQARLQGVVEKLSASGRRLVWLEALAEEIGTGAKLRGLVAERAAARFAQRRCDSDAPAVILFTSGSEGAPKAVVLTSRNILANIAQVAARVDFNPTDRVLNALPIFHSFGLTGATLLPILNGVRTLLYPNPLHFGTVAAFAYDANATILFGSDTFLAGYARVAQPYDFFRVRYIFAGAEPVKPQTRATFYDKFGLRLLEGYGASECSPVIAVNTPMHFQAGSVGQLLPGLEHRLDPVEGIEEGGRLVVSGPNVMAGYFKADAPGVLQPPQGGWYDTGDICTLDETGFVTIRGRAKRFAKIGGEMVSLAAVEGYAKAIWPDAEHAAVARPEPRKGEELVLFTTAAGADTRALKIWAREHGVAELSLPREVRVVDALPVLGTGKPDYVTMNEQAREKTPEPA